MPSIVYDSMVDAMARGTIAFASDSFRVLLVNATYVPDKAAHKKRGDITGEVSGAGYTAGGQPVSVVVTTDLALNRTDIALGGATWPASSISARGAVYYDSRGGLATADELVCYIDFGEDIISASGDFTLDPSTVRIQN